VPTAIPSARDGSAASANSLAKRYIIAWALALVFYFLEYAARSSPAVMIPQLSTAFGATAVGVSAIIGTYYYTYSVTNLVAGVALDRAGGKWVIAIGAFVLAAGCFGFTVSSLLAANVGRLLQGAGSAFAFTGAVYLATHGFSARRLATAIGVTQCLGMLGGWAGQSVVGPMIHREVPWQTIWNVLGTASLLTGLLLFIITPARERSVTQPSTHGSLLRPYGIVFSNLQSYLCGLVGGLLFVPTTVGAMIWGVAFFQKDLAFSYTTAVTTASMVPLGWVVGCPLLGWLADRVGRRKPPLIWGAVIMLLAMTQLAYLPALMPAQLTAFIFGIASGAAMIPYTIIKEANPDEVKGSATGAINFLVFAVTAVIGPVFARFVGKGFDTGDHIGHFRSGASFWIVCILVAVVLNFLLRETGHARRPSPA
jgi:MFS family permease